MKKMRLAFRAARMGVWDLDLRTRAIQWSPDLSVLLGLDPLPEATRWTHLDRIHPEDREPVQSAVAAACAGEPARDFEFRMSGANGTWHVMSASTLLEVGPDGAPVRLVASLRDVTRRSLLEAAIKQATKVEAVGLLATNLTHDFNKRPLVASRSSRSPGAGRPFACSSLRVGAGDLRAQSGPRG